MPLQHLDQVRGLEVGLDQPHRQLAQVLLRQARVHGGQTGRADHQMRHLVKVVVVHVDAARVAVDLLEPVFVHGKAAGSGLETHVAPLEIFLQRHALPRVWVMNVDHDPVGVLEQHLARLGRRRLVPGMNDEIDVSRFQLGRGGVAGHAYFQRNTGRLAIHLLHHVNQKYAGGVVGCNHRKVPLRGRWVEHGTRGDGRIDAKQYVIDRLQQALRQRSQLHLAPDLHDQRVVEEVPQPGQDAAHRRLRDVQLLTRAGDISLSQEGFERIEQIEVESLVAHVGLSRFLMA